MDMQMMEMPSLLEAAGLVSRQRNMAEGESRPVRMKRYRGWPVYPNFLQDCKNAAESDILVTPPVAAAILGYSRVRMTRLLDQEEIVSWAWFEPNTFHASELFVSVRSLVVFGLNRKRLGVYENEIPLQAVIDRASYERLRQEIVT